MGKLVYGDSDMEIEIDDRTLTHLQVVIGSKLRRGESFFFSWNDDVSVGGGRASIWMNTSIPLYFKYFGGKTPLLNRDWIGLMTDSANSGRGLVFIPEPGGTARAPHGHL